MLRMHRARKRSRDEWFVSVCLKPRSLLDDEGKYGMEVNGGGSQVLCEMESDASEVGTGMVVRRSF